MSTKRKKTILVVCHDAGGAEIISSYVKKNLSDYNFLCLAKGPAENIFKRKNLGKCMIPKKNNPKKLLTKNEDLKMVLAGTSWASSIEIDFIRAAKKLMIKTVTYLDHWVNYRERFGYPRKNWQQNLPDEIWLGDKYAYNLAKKFFKKPVLKLVPNLYFKEIKEKYKKMQESRKTRNNGILFFSEPLGSKTNCFGDEKKLSLNELDILAKILDFFARKNKKQKIIIRFHPAENHNKYDSIIKKYAGKLEIIKSKNQDIIYDISRSHLAIGMESMALVISYLCGKKTVSFLPNFNQKCSLPFKRIKKINKLADLYFYLAA